MMTSGMFEEWFLPGIWITIQVTLYSAILGVFVAFTIGTLRTSRFWIVRFLSGIYFEVFRGMSALVLMIWMFFSLPLLLRLQFEPLFAGVLALGLTYGAYGSEIVRGALAAVPTAQREAGIALSFTRMQRLRRIEIPQAWPEMVPPFNNLLIELMKGTALVSIITVPDVTYAGGLIRFVEGESGGIYGLLLVIYFVYAFILTRGMRVLERQAKKGIGQAPPPGGFWRRFGLRTAAGEGTTTPAAATAGGAK